MKLDSQRITWREIDGELVILDLAASTYLTTNETGTALLKELVEERSTEELVEVLMSAFDVTSETAVADVRAFVEDLDRNGLLAQASQLERR
ncbi:coenzyme PQQ synthesis protein D (PqqD) [Nocardioides albertanoniae]|uniref:Coenzyme PQQ synthesis protein D (PqqD) n=1 Tax=Nocardioides albertanoniae TaxID=1175486 RepID=A0A543ABI8_9ACTN|nr:PqqD family protein [Nocardioides albertanoniae]TQL69964.1 coenzyme PQQ synthesis protein D (PqqD) [Nocardioides albertanoniae]